MNPAPNSLKYSLSWASNVIQRFYAQYTRATDMLCEVLDIGYMDLAKYLASGDPLWPILRTTIHRLNENLKFYGDRYTTEHLLSIFEGKLRVKRFGNQAERLDKRVKLVKLKKQGSRGEGAGGEAEGSQPTPPSLPSDPDRDAYGRKWL